MTDVNFTKILSELKLFHKDFPTVSFGNVIQVALDRKKLTSNVDLNNISSKQLLLCLKTYREYLKKHKKEKEGKLTRIKENEENRKTHEEMIGEQING